MKIDQKLSDAQYMEKMKDERAELVAAMLLRTFGLQYQNLPCLLRKQAV